MIARVNDDSAEKLRYLAARQLVPGTRVCVLEREPFGGPIRLRVRAGEEQREQSVGPELAAEILVAPDDTKR